MILRMSSTTARTSALIVELYLGYQVVFGVVEVLARLPVYLGQGTRMPELMLSLLSPFLEFLPYAVAAFLLFWLAPLRNTALPWLGLGIRAILAAAGGSVLSWIYGVAMMLQVTGGLLTSIPRSYTLPGGLLAGAPTAVISGFAQNFPIIALAAFIGWALAHKRASAFDRRRSVE